MASSNGKDAPAETISDDIDAYVATSDDEERRDLAAEAAIDIAILLQRARERRSLSQAAASGLAGLQQQAVTRFEPPAANPRLETIQEHLGALGYGLQIKAIDMKTGEAAATVILPPSQPRHAQPRRSRSTAVRPRTATRS